MTSFLYVETYESHASLHLVLTEPSSADTEGLGEQTRGANWRQVHQEIVEERAWRKWLTFLPGRAWGLGLHVSLV